MTTALPAGLTPGAYNADISHSEANFVVRHAGIAKVKGNIPITSAVITVGEDLTSTSVEAELDPNGVNTRDENRDNHLRSADFFDIENFPTWTFKSTSISADAGAYKITGDLTIHGVTQQVTLDAEFEGTAVDPFGNTRAGFAASVEISRKDFGLTWNAALEAGGFLVSDKVKIELDVSAIAAA